MGDGTGDDYDDDRNDDNDDNYGVYLAEQTVVLWSKVVPIETRKFHMRFNNCCIERTMFTGTTECALSWARNAAKRAER